MSYIINNSRGNVVAVVADGTINTSATSLGLVGRSTTDYGVTENENYVFLLENFANDAAPLNAVLGQLWYNSDTDRLSVYDSANVWLALATENYVDQSFVNATLSGVSTAPTAAPGTATTQIATTAFVSNSPQFSGVPTAPTAVPGTATTQIATTAFVSNSPQLSGTPTAPTAPPGTATTQIATTAFVSNSPQFTGTPTATTAAASDNSTRIATTAFVQDNKVSPAFSGTPTAPTATYNDNSAQIASTAFVQGEKVSPQFLGAPTAPTATVGTANAQIATTEFVRNFVGGSPGTLATQNANAVAITGGTITGVDPIPVASGGTGAGTSAIARDNLGLGTLATQNANAVNITGGDIVGIAPLAVISGGTGAGTAEIARFNLGLGSLATQNASNVAITGGVISGISPLAVDFGGTGADNAVDARQNLGITGLATQPSDGVNLTGGSITNVNLSDLVSPLAVTSGGTGANNAVTARVNLGLGSLATQNDSSVNITGGFISGVAPIPIESGGTGGDSSAQARTNLGLGSLSTQNDSSVNITGGSITGITPLPITAGGTGANTAAQARTNLGLSGIIDDLGTMSQQNSDGVNITGGTITGITELAVADGGTGASTAAQARTNLGAADSAIQISAGAGLTGGGDLSTNRTLSIASNSNGFGTRFVQTGEPVPATDGDIWYQI